MLHRSHQYCFLSCSALSGEVSPVLASRALSQVPVLRGGSHGGVQHASVHPAGVQSHGRQGGFMSVLFKDSCSPVVCNITLLDFSALFLIQLIAVKSHRCKCPIELCVLVSQHNRLTLSTGHPTFLTQPLCLQIILTDSVYETFVCARPSVHVHIRSARARCVPVIDNSS